MQCNEIVTIVSDQICHSFKKKLKGMIQIQPLPLFARFHSFYRFFKGVPNSFFQYLQLEFSDRPLDLELDLDINLWEYIGTSRIAVSPYCISLQTRFLDKSYSVALFSLIVFHNHLFEQLVTSRVKCDLLRS